MRIPAEVKAQREGRSVFNLEQDEMRKLGGGVFLAVSVPGLHSQLCGEAHISSLVDLD